MANTKHIIITSISLGLIAAGSAALIGVANLITRDRIEKNKQIKIDQGIARIFGEGSSKTEDFDLTEYKYSNHFYRVNSPVHLM